MLIRKRITRKLLLCATVIALVGGTVASFAALNASKSVKNTFNTGGIKIDVENYTEKGGKEVLLDEKTVVDFNGDTSFIPKIENKAEECYIRVAPKTVTEVQSIDILKFMYGISSDWIEKDGYLYYMNPVENGETVTFCEGFDIPYTWDYMQSNEMYVTVNVDAVQSKNFTPDFDSDNPWGDVAVTGSQVGDGYSVDAMAPVKGDGSIKIVCSNNPDGITISTDDFFKDVSFMPGDKYEDTLTVVNDSKKRTSILFRTEYEESDLLNEMNLGIYNAPGKAFYEGALASEDLKEYKEILLLEPGESKTIDVSVELPAEAGNEYQVSSDFATWYFAFVQDPDAVQTGDESSMIAISVICFASAAALIILLKKRREEACE